MIDRITKDWPTGASAIFLMAASLAWVLVNFAFGLGFFMGHLIVQAYFQLRKNP